MPRIATSADLNPSAEKARSIALLTMSYLLPVFGPHTSKGSRLLRQDRFMGLPGPVSEHLLVAGEDGDILWLHPMLRTAFQGLLDQANKTCQDLAHMAGDWAYRTAIAKGSEPEKERTEARQRAADLSSKLLRSVSAELQAQSALLDRSQTCYDLIRCGEAFPDAKAALAHIDTYCDLLPPPARWRLAAIARETVITEIETPTQERFPDLLGYLHAASTMLDPQCVSLPDPAQVSFAFCELAACLDIVTTQGGDRHCVPGSTIEIVVQALASGYSRAAFNARITSWPVPELIIHRLRHRLFSRTVSRCHWIARQIVSIHGQELALTRHQQIEIFALAQTCLREVGIDHAPTFSWARQQVEMSVAQP